MQIPPLSAQGLTPATVTLGGPSRTDRAEPTELRPTQLHPATIEADPASSRPLRSRLQVRDAQINQRIAAGQQTLAYLDELASRIETLKSDLSAQLANPALQRPLDQQLQGVGALWAQRQSTTLGSLDGQLRYHPNGGAQQSFQVRGLDQRALQSSERETLSFSTGAAGPAEQRVQTVIFEAGQDEASRVRLLDHSLAPVRIRVRQSAQGEVLLTTPEAQWPAVRDGLSIKGGGIRFPGQQAPRVKVEAQADAIAPARWSAADDSSQRHTLQQLVPALRQIQHTRQSVRSDLESAGAQLQDRAAVDTSRWAQGFAQDFAAISERPPYAVFAAVAPAVQGISRPRVQALLKASDT